MRPQDAVDQKPEFVFPATPISTPTSTFNPNATIIELVLTLRSCFQLQDFEEAAAILQSREDKLKQNITGLKNREDKLNLNNIELRNQLQNVTNKCASLEANRENFAVEKERIETELMKCKAEREKFAVEKERIETELKKSRAEGEKFGVEKERIETELMKCKADHEKFAVEKEIIETELKKSRAEREKFGVEKERIETELMKCKAEREKFAVEEERIETELMKCEADREKFGVEKKRIQAELKKCKSDCDVYRDDKLSTKYELEKIRLELKMWREKEVICVERYENRIAELEKERKDESEGMRGKIVKLQEDLEKRKDEIVGLVDGKKKAEELATYWEDKYKQVEAKVMKLENDMVMIFASYPVLEKSVEKVLLLRNPPAINPKSVNNGNLELVERQKQSNLSKCDANAHASPCAGSTAESQLVDTNGRAEAGPNSSVTATARGNRMPTENQVVIEIDDSDDEKPMIETASALKTGKDYGRSCDKDPASQSISRGKRPLVCTQNNDDVGDGEGSNKNKKHKMDSAFLNKANENSYLSDEGIPTLAMEKLVSKIRKNKPFNFEVEMLTAFNKDDELCLNAVCALHRVQKCDELHGASQFRGFSAINATRGCHLAKFLIDGDPQGKLQKSVVELQEYDSKGVELKEYIEIELQLGNID
ncbi:hypothetical protein POM88_019421 [Heracleum sosnowskyi]|uniref:Uncharacterized protein n=1 Tax=Heracleum sosnowskyi TaxID=360622 RepID=A0AAD8IAW3_9APIA|nr:hypothetical protein POM88_019421 [Heracleum sosnowskyi]